MHDWLSLVDLSGLLVSEPVLRDQFPHDTPPIEEWLARRFRTEYERWISTRDQGRWVDFILRHLLAYPEGQLRGAMSLPPHLTIDLTDYMQRLKPEKALVDADGQPLLLIGLAADDLDKPETTSGRWKAAPFTKMDRLLRETRIPLGLLTNGDQWRLIYAAPGLTTATLTWNAATWLDDRSTLSAFRMLLADPACLLEMASESQQRQADVTDQLGGQVLRAMNIFVGELDRLNRSTGGALLGEMSPDEIYQMALFVMMRLVFMLYAEENRLLPHGQVFYDRGYGLTGLWNQLEQERRLSGDQFDQKIDAYPRLLAAFHLIYEGCGHPDFIMPAYGGRLFDPARYPVLEDPRLHIHNLAIWKLIYHLTTVETSDGRQRVSYRALDVEQLGYTYEGLLSYTVQAARETLIQPPGSKDAYPLAQFENALAHNKLYEFLKSISDLHWNKSKGLAEAVRHRSSREGLVDPLLDPPPLAGEGRVGVPDPRWQWEPVTDSWIAPGSLHLALQMGVRKRGGIFYTPPQLTSFLVQQALEPQVYNPTSEEGLTPSLIRPRWRGRIKEGVDQIPPRDFSPDRLRPGDGIGGVSCPVGALSGGSAGGGVGCCRCRPPANGAGDALC